MESDRAPRILRKAASALASLGLNNACISQGRDPSSRSARSHAATIAADGWTRADVQSFLYERARLRLGDLRAAFDRRRWRPWMLAE
jgi:hypothetical protein